MKSIAPELYTLLHRGHPGDLQFYQRVCGDPGRVLELGCGYGRIAWALAGAGHEVVAVDRDAQLLALAREAASEHPEATRRRLSWVQADMCELDIDGHFDRVLIAFNTLCCLLTRERVAACLATAQRRLGPRGLLALDVYRADPMHAEGDEDDQEEPSLVIALEHEGNVLDVYEQSHLHTAEQRLDTSYHFVPRDGGSTIIDTIAQRYLLEPELETLLDEAGLRIVQRYGGFNDEPIDDDAEHLVFVAQPR